MRRLLLTTTALLFLAAPVLAQPHGDEHREDRHPGNAGGAAPQVEQRAQPESRPQGPQPQRGGDRSDRGPRPQAAVQPSPNPGAQNRGNGQGHLMPQASVQSPPDRGSNTRPQNFNRADQGRDQNDRRAFNDNRPSDNRLATPPNNMSGNRQNSNRDFNRDGRTDYRGQRAGGPRHDFSGFRDFHRDFQASRRFRGPDYRRPAGWYSHRWAFGEFLPTAFWARDYWLSDFGDYDLPPPPYGAVWVRVDRDALLIDEESGEIITVEYSVFY